MLPVHETEVIPVVASRDGSEGRAGRLALTLLAEVSGKDVIHALWATSACPLRTDASDLRETSSKTRRPASPDLTVGLEAIYHHISLSLVLPKVPEELFLLRVILSYPLKAAFTKPSMYLSSSASPR